jgi:DNA-binding response OmpR family regulator
LNSTDVLKGKRILLVDDEPDVLATVKEILTMCELDTASAFEAAREKLASNPYDAAILDIMGVNGYDLLDLAATKGIPTLMLTAHALSSENFFKSIKQGASAYIPKDKLHEIDTYLRDILTAIAKRSKGTPKWFARLEKFFERKFGADWKNRQDQEFWKKYFYI